MGLPKKQPFTCNFILCVMEIEQCYKVFIRNYFLKYYEYELTFCDY